MLCVAALEAYLGAVVDHRNAARREQPVVRVDEARVVGLHARHVVVVVERHQVVRVGVRAVFQVQRLADLLVAGARFLEHLGQFGLQRKVQHAVAAVAGPGMAGDAGGVVVEVLAEHEEARFLRADAVGEFLPERMRHPGDGVHAERRRALVDPLLVCADQVLHHRRVVLVEVGQLRQATAGVVEGVQRLAARVQPVRIQVLVVGDQPAVLVPDLAVLGLHLRHRIRGRAVVADDVQHHVQLLFLHGAGETGEIQPFAGQVFVELVEVDAPVAVVAGLAAVGEHPGPLHFFAAGEGFIRVVHDRRDPHRGEAEVADVAGVVEHAFEVAA